jgi:hypothetical protein
LTIDTLVSFDPDPSKISSIIRKIIGDALVVVFYYSCMIYFLNKLLYDLLMGK